MGELIVAALVLVGFVAAGAWLVVSRGKQMAALAARGVPVTATVTMKRKQMGGASNGAHRRIGYRYTAPDGRSFERFATLTIGRFAEVEEGGPFPIYMLPDDPGTAAPDWIVDAARGAMARR